MILSAWVLVCVQTPGAPPPSGAAPAAVAIVDEARTARQRALQFLLRTQNPDGSWGGARNATYNDLWANPETHEAWTVATTGLVVMALLGEDESARPVLERAIPRLVRGSALQRCSYSRR